MCVCLVLGGSDCHPPDKKYRGKSLIDLLVVISEGSEEIEPNLFNHSLFNLGTLGNGTFAILCSFHCNNSMNLVWAMCCCFTSALSVVSKALYLRVVIRFILGGVPG